MHVLRSESPLPGHQVAGRVLLNPADSDFVDYKRIRHDDEYNPPHPDADGAHPAASSRRSWP